MSFFKNLLNPFKAAIGGGAMAPALPGAGGVAPTAAPVPVAPGGGQPRGGLMGVIGDVLSTPLDVIGGYREAYRALPGKIRDASEMRQLELEAARRGEGFAREADAATRNGDPNKRLAYITSPAALGANLAGRYGVINRGMGQTTQFGEGGESVTAPIMGMDEGRGFTQTANGVTETGKLAPSYADQQRDQQIALSGREVDLRERFGTREADLAERQLAAQIEQWRSAHGIDRERLNISRGRGGGIQAPLGVSEMSTDELLAAFLGNN